MLGASRSPSVSAANVSARLLHCLCSSAQRVGEKHTHTHSVQHFLPSPIQSDVILTHCLGSDIMAIFTALWMFKEAQRASSCALAELHIDQLLYKRDYIGWDWPVGWVHKCDRFFKNVFIFFPQNWSLTCLSCTDSTNSSENIYTMMNPIGPGGNRPNVSALAETVDWGVALDLTHV